MLQVPTKLVSSTVTMTVCHTLFDDIAADILDPAEVKKHFDRIGHFRILVLGRSNAGKTTLLRRVCGNTTELLEIFNAKGEKVKYLFLPYHMSLQVTDSPWHFAD